LCSQYTTKCSQCQEGISRIELSDFQENDFADWMSPKHPIGKAKISIFSSLFSLHFPPWLFPEAAVL
jgi:hypothetical protein